MYQCAGVFILRSVICRNSSPSHGVSEESAGKEKKKKERKKEKKRKEKKRKEKSSTLYIEW